MFKAYKFSLVGSAKVNTGEGTHSHTSFPGGQLGSVEMVSVPLVELMWKTTCTDSGKGLLTW